MKTERSQVYYDPTQTGRPRYAVELRHHGLDKFQIIRAADQREVQEKASATAANWDKIWDTKKARLDKKQFVQSGKRTAAKRTDEATVKQDALASILAHTLSIDDTIDWDSLKSTEEYPEPAPDAEAYPVKPSRKSPPKEPVRTDERFRPQLGLWDKISSASRQKKIDQAAARFQLEHDQWSRTKMELESDFQRRLTSYETAFAEIDAKNKKDRAEWEADRDAYREKQVKDNQRIDQEKERYLSAEPQAVELYCEKVLKRSQYPSFHKPAFDLEFNPTNGILICNYQLPPKERIPTLLQVSFVQSRGEFNEKHLGDAALNKVYESALYQITLRSIHELFEADQINVLRAIAFNGFVRSIDKGTGKEVTACILSVQTTKEEFEEINLALVDPKTCFKSLKGVGSAKLSNLAPVAPLLTMNREDSRFVTSHAVADSIQEGDNLATMDWEEFEHLVRELFETEFAGSGGEVKVTQASRDGGVDAVAFDPDPIRGGKIVIQAKRYANTVGVAAVRDLYGTVVNEGAIKGILVTTSDYGPDAYNFAKDKPLTLLNGNNLLHMLGKHGRKARIDLKEAKEYFKDLGA